MFSHLGAFLPPLGSVPRDRKVDHCPNTAGHQQGFSGSRQGGQPRPKRLHVIKKTGNMFVEGIQFFKKFT